jgi:hypothetical protein
VRKIVALYLGKFKSLDGWRSAPSRTGQGTTGKLAHFTDPHSRRTFWRHKFQRTHPSHLGLALGGMGVSYLTAFRPSAFPQQRSLAPSFAALHRLFALQ